MISGEYTVEQRNSAILESNHPTINLEGKSVVLAEVSTGAKASSRLETDSNVLGETGMERHSNIATFQAEQCTNTVQTGEKNTAVITAPDRKVYEIPVTSSSNAILSLRQGDALTPNNEPIVPIITENSDFGTQISTSGNNLLEGFINPNEKDELDSAGSMENIVLGRQRQEDDGSVLNDSTQVDDHAGTTASDKLCDQQLGDLPPWAARLKGCERIGDSYRGYVHNEVELDELLSMHKEHTHSSWGTRQSPSSQKPSVRFMWKSQYVPYDGIPFLNSGRRATVMECQYGPRRKGNKVKVEYNEDGQPVKPAHRPTCPARIYIKRVRKFPEFKVDKSYEGTPGLRLAQERALTALRVACPESQGEERFYVQFPLELAHEYHNEEDEIFPHQSLSLLPTQANIGSSRLDSRVVEKINELVARGVTDIYQVKHGVINFVEKDLFLCGDERIPARQNKLFFPTITDLQNHIHQALLALESGTLESLPPPENLPKLPSKDDRSRKRKRAEPRRVRASKTSPGKTICIRTDDSMELARDASLQDAQGQVYVMVPSAGNLFPNSESLIGTSLDGGEKGTSLVQVLTVPSSSSSSFLEQQGDSRLDITGPFLALPVVNCDSAENSSIVVQDTLGKEPVPAITASLVDAKNQDALSRHTLEDHLQTTNIHIQSVRMTGATTVSPSTVTITTPRSPNVTITSQRPSSTIKVASSNLSMASSNAPISGNDLVRSSMRETAAIQNENAGLAMTSSGSSQIVSMTCPDISMTSSNLDLKSSIPGLEMTSPYTPVTSNIFVSSSSLTQPITSTPGTTVASSSSDVSSHVFPISYESITSPTILMASPDKIAAPKALGQTEIADSDMNRFTGVVHRNGNTS